jgi:hypothetical protein
MEDMGLGLSFAAPPSLPAPTGNVRVSAGTLPAAAGPDRPSDPHAGAQPRARKQGDVTRGVGTGKRGRPRAAPMGPEGAYFA